MIKLISRKVLDNGNIEYRFDLEDIDRDCWCWGNFYKKIGITKDLEQHKDRADVRYIKATDKTDRTIKDKIVENYSLVRLNHNGKVVYYRKRKRTLSNGELYILGIDYLNYSPSSKDTEDMEDMVIVFEIS